MKIRNCFFNIGLFTVLVGMRTCTSPLGIKDMSLEKSRIHETYDGNMWNILECENKMVLVCRKSNCKEWLIIQEKGSQRFFPDMNIAEDVTEKDEIKNRLDNGEDIAFLEEENINIIYVDKIWAAGFDALLVGNTEELFPLHRDSDSIENINVYNAIVDGNFKRISSIAENKLPSIPKGKGVTH